MRSVVRVSYRYPPRVFRVGLYVVVGVVGVLLCILTLRALPVPPPPTVVCDSSSVVFFEDTALFGQQVAQTCYLENFTGPSVRVVFID